MPEPDHQDLVNQHLPRVLEDWLCVPVRLWIDIVQNSYILIGDTSCSKTLSKKFAAIIIIEPKNGDDEAINYKHDAFMFGCAVVDIERGQFADQKPYFWQTDTSVARNSWCYTENNVYKTAYEIICDLVDVVSKNGCLLLNIGPKADGTIPEEDQSILLEIGEWLKINGEAIYDSRVWRVAGEGPTAIDEGQFTDGKAKTFTPEDIRFTVRDQHLRNSAIIS